MSFDYEKLKSKSDAGSGEHWTSNSDLFMVLSVVFLLLYVVASVKNGASAINKAIQVIKTISRINKSDSASTPAGKIIILPNKAAKVE